MKAGKVYGKTMQFVWLKVGVGLLEMILSLLLLFLGVTLGNAAGGERGMLTAFILWFVTMRAGKSIVSHVAGYLIKAGHVAVVAEACMNGKVPKDPLKFGFGKVKKRFGASAAFFAADRLIDGAVRQIQRAVGRIGGFLSFIPGMDTVTKILEKFIGIFLGYIDECCLGWCFLHEEEGTFHMACDGVAIYFQNAKYLIKSAAVTTLTVILMTGLAGAVSYLAGIGLAGSHPAGVYIAIVAAAELAFLIKTSFIDSYMMVKMMCSFMEVAPGTEISTDLYGKLCGLSGSFKKMFKKAQKEEAAPACC